MSQTEEFGCKMMGRREGEKYNNYKQYENWGIEKE